MDPETPDDEGVGPYAAAFVFCLGAVMAGLGVAAGLLALGTLVVRLMGGWNG